MEKKTGVLLINTGSPRSTRTADIRTYLRQFLMDGRVIDMPSIPRWLLVNLIISPTRAKKSQVRYKRIWQPDGSPLITHSRDVRDMLSQKLGSAYVIESAMRYGSPGIQDTLYELRTHDITDLRIIPMFPQYASATTGSIMEEVYRVLQKWTVIPSVSISNSFFDDPLFISAWVDRGRTFWEDHPNHVLFSFHGLPERQVTAADASKTTCLRQADCCLSNPRSDCYRAQCFKTAELIARGLGIPKKQYSVSFQSRLGRTKWISPYTSETVVQLAESGVKKLLVFCPAFVADCLETLDEIQYEEKNRFEASGGKELVLVPSLNRESLWLSCLENMITR